MSLPIRVAVVGLGKIAHDQHLPAIARSDHFRLVAGASPEGEAPGVPTFRCVEELLSSNVGVDALVLCQPPQFRYEAARIAIRAGKHVLLEKPPGSVTLEVEHLAALAGDQGTTLYTAWHSRFAPGVQPARQWLASRRILEVAIEWREDVEFWHPGQAWIWQAGGFGVFDPGINALSLLTFLMPEPLRVMEGTLEIPRNRAAPIGASVLLRSASDVAVRAVFDFRQKGPQTWSIRFRTDSGTLELLDGGAALQIAGTRYPVGTRQEYAGIYEAFAELVRLRRSDVDITPLRLVADAFMRCRTEFTDPVRA